MKTKEKIPPPPMCYWLEKADGIGWHGQPFITEGEAIIFALLYAYGPFCAPIVLDKNLQTCRFVTLAPEVADGVSV